MSALDWPVEVDPVFGCWLWQAKRDPVDGSGLIWRGKMPVRAYIVVYAAERGAVKSGIVLEHMCQRRQCVAPHHLEPVTKDENEKRRSWRYRSRIMRCPAGHDMKLNAIVIPPKGGRVCRTCNGLAS